jgi:hypothetical protein
MGDCGRKVGKKGVGKEKAVFSGSEGSLVENYEEQFRGGEQRLEKREQ